MKLSFKKWLQSVFNAFEGIKYACSQQNFFIMILLTIISLGLGFWLKISYYEWLALIIVIGSVLSLEMLNTMVETALDILEPTKSLRVKQIKDTLAGAVLIACLMALIIGILIFSPKLLLMFIMLN
ncbi:MAG: diacylglycerol kinase family protein [Candidatus Pacebacteria bacterium]|nr:diacylglycerol kinase family protein [Candidatus Paceibacterota bacterium]